MFLMQSVRVKNLILMSDLCMLDFEVCATLCRGLVQHIGNVCSPLQISSSVLIVLSIPKCFYTFFFLFFSIICWEIRILLYL